VSSADSQRQRGIPSAAEIVRTRPDGAIIAVHVQPNASRTACAGIHGQAVKIRVAAPPSDGAANDELCRFLARLCDLPSSAVVILSGAGSRQKRVLVKGRSAEQVRAQLQLP